MIENLFNKNKNLEKDTQQAEATEQAAGELSEAQLQAWHARITAAASDDAALLQLAHDAPSVPLKLAALEALTHEPALKQAMHDFRDHDKRLYRAVKARWDAAHGKRTAGDEAATLITNARALLEQPVVPVNRVVELDQAWAALNRDFLDAATVADFTSLSEQLGTRVREQGERAQALTRWLAAIDDASAKLNAPLPGVAQGDVAPDALDALALTLLDLTQNLPASDDARAGAKAQEAQRMLALAASVGERAKFLRALPAPGVADDAQERQLIEQWRGFPEMSEGALHSVLAQRFADWRNAMGDERQRNRETQSAEQREQHRERVQAIETEVAAAEAAQAAGQLAELTKHINAIDQALKQGNVHAGLAQRIDALKREQKRLHDWQRWSGAQSREQLATEAQALAEAAKAGKVSIKAHGDAITKLRERWKDLDKTGAPSAQSVWHTFNGALEAAYAPVAAHLEKLKQQRAENLAAREKVVATLAEAAARFFPPVEEGAPAATTDWRAVAHALEEAQVAWRKLGPVEHTVPRQALKGEKAITTRYAKAVEALEAPLKTAQSGAREQRSKLIADAKALAAGDTRARDVIDKVRKLQTQWQAAAKAMPLNRRDENALWTEFKAATDAIFAARDAARNAAEAEFAAKLKAHEAVIVSLAALREANNAADVKRVLREADSAWRAAPDIPKQHAAKMQARYRAARDAANRRITELAAHAEQARYDALLTKIALCEEREKLFDASDASATLDMAQAADLEDRWNAVAHFPDGWKPKLDARFAGLASPTAAAADKKATAKSLPDLLLDLEVACGIDSPAEFAAVRQQLKLRALKTAMEGRQAVVTTPADIERWLVDAAAQPRPDAVSRERLQKIIAAVRRRPQR